MNYVFETVLVGVAAFLVLLGAAFSKDPLFASHMWIIFAVLFISTVLLLRRIQFSSVPVDKSQYFDEVVRYGTVAIVFWGVIGFLIGVVVAAQLAFPDLNIEPWFNFGRMRPLHTSLLYSPLVATR